MADLIRIRSESLTAAIHPLGAELWSLKDGARELMTDADPAFWTGHAPLLFPIVGRLNGDTYRLNGKAYHLPQHGFARKKRFELVEREEEYVWFRLEADQETRAAYPFEFRFDMEYALDADMLHMTATITNFEGHDMPFSFGFHPAFAWPLPYGAPAEEHLVAFAEDEPAPIRRIGTSPGLISPQSQPTPVEGNMLIPDHAMFEGDALIWDDLNSRGLSWGAPGTPSLDMIFPDTPWLGIWQKPGAHYICIEPWAGMADPEGFDGEIWDKPGIMRLKSGESRQFRMVVRLAEN